MKLTEIESIVINNQIFTTLPVTPKFHKKYTDVIYIQEIKRRNSIIKESDNLIERMIVYCGFSNGEMIFEINASKIDVIFYK